MGEGDGGAVAEIAGDVVLPDVALQFVGRAHHHEVGPFRRVGDRHHLLAGLLGLGGGAGARPERDHDLLDAGIAEVLRMGMPLAAIADDGDLLRLDQIEIGIPIVIDAHDGPARGEERFSRASF